MDEFDWMGRAICEDIQNAESPAEAEKVAASWVRRCVEAAIASSAGAGVAAELEAEAAALRAVVAALPGLPRCIKCRKWATTSKAGERVTHFCDEHAPPIGTPGAFTLRYAEELRALEAARSSKGQAPSPKAAVDTCPRCHLVTCSPECIAAEQAEVDAYDGPKPEKFA